MRPLHTLLITCVLAFVFALPVQAHAQVDINQADAKTLAGSLNGVGLVKAEAIVAWRQQHGPFLRIEDLAKVRGFGAKTIEANREIIVIGPATSRDKTPG